MRIRKNDVSAVTVLAALALVISLSLAQQSAPPTEAAQAESAVPTMEQAGALLEEDNFEAAAEAFHMIVRKNPDNARAWHLRGYSLHAAGNLVDALPCHLMAAEFTQTAPVASYNVACVYSLRDKADKAFEWLNKARDLGFSNREQIEGDSDMDNIRDDPRFDAFVKSLGHTAPGTGMQESAPGGASHDDDDAR